MYVFYLPFIIYFLLIKKKIWEKRVCFQAKQIDIECLVGYVNPFPNNKF